jgi:hypothetical protein
VDRLARAYDGSGPSNTTEDVEIFRHAEADVRGVTTTTFKRPGAIPPRCKIGPDSEPALGATQDTDLIVKIPPSRISVSLPAATPAEFHRFDSAAHSAVGELLSSGRSG